MNYKAMDWAFRQSMDDASAKFLLVTLAGHANADGECFPSYRRLSEMTGLSVRTLKSKMHKLRAAGLVTSVVRRRPNGSQTSSTYRLTGCENCTPLRDNNIYYNNYLSINYGGAETAPCNNSATDFEAMAREALSREKEREREI